jgi:hypothetical protein
MKGAAIKAFANLEKGSKVRAASCSSIDRERRDLGAFPRSPSKPSPRPINRYTTRRTQTKEPTNHSGPGTGGTPLRRRSPTMTLIPAIPARPLERPPTPSGGWRAAGVEGQAHAQGVESQVPTRSLLPSVGPPHLTPNLSLCDPSFSLSSKGSVLNSRWQIDSPPHGAIALPSQERCVSLVDDKRLCGSLLAKK